MTRDEVVSLIAGRFGYRTDLDSKIVAELKLAQTELEMRPELPWFLLSEMSTTTQVSAAEERVLLPTDYLRDYEYGFLWRYDSTASDPWVELAKDDYGSLKAAHTEAGAPTKYSIRGINLTLHPIPDASYTLKMVYYQQAAELSSNIENVWTKYAPAVLLNRAGIAVAQNLQDARVRAQFAEAYAAAASNMDSDTIARHETAALQNMGDD